MEEGDRAGVIQAERRCSPYGDRYLLGDKLSADSAEEGEQVEAGGQVTRHASEEERLAAKEKLARWKAEK